MNARTATDPIYPFRVDATLNSLYSSHRIGHRHATMRVRNVEDKRNDHAVQIEFNGYSVTSGQSRPFGFGFTLDAEQARTLAATVAPEFVAMLEVCERTLSGSLAARGYEPGSCSDGWEPAMRDELATLAQVRALLERVVA